MNERTNEWRWLTLQTMISDRTDIFRIGNTEWDATARVCPIHLCVDNDRVKSSCTLIRNGHVFPLNRAFPSISINDHRMHKSPTHTLSRHIWTRQRIDSRTLIVLHMHKNGLVHHLDTWSCFISSSSSSSCYCCSSFYYPATRDK